MISLLQSERNLSLQVIDFSPVITIFHLISSFFTPFLSRKGLVSRRLGKKHGLFESRVIEKKRHGWSSASAWRRPASDNDMEGAKAGVENRIGEIGVRTMSDGKGR